MNVDACPKCHVSWLGDNILDTLKQARDEGTSTYKGMTDSQLYDDMLKYWSPPYKWRKEIGIEYMRTSEDYDGISEYRCFMCNARFGRWTGKELPDGYIEPKYGRGGKPVKDKECETSNHSL